MLVDFFAVFVNFYDRAINDECAVIRVRLEGLFVVSIAELGFEVFVQSGNFIFIGVVLKYISRSLFLRFLLLDQLRLMFISIQVVKFIIELVQIKVIIVLLLLILHQHIFPIRHKLCF